MEDLIHRKIKKCPNCCNEDLVQRKTEYFTTLTIDTEDLVTERQSTSQHLQGKFGTQKDRVLHNTYMDRKTKYSTTLTWKIWYTERQSTSQHLQGRFGTQKDKVLHNTYMARKTKYFTTLTWKIWYTERQSTSQHFQVTWRIWSIQRHTKTEYFTPLTSYMC